MIRLLMITPFLAILFAVMPECASLQLRQPGQDQDPGRGQGQEVEQPVAISPRIGLCTEFMRLSSSKRREMMEVMKPLGKRTIRETFMWNAIEPRKGEFRWASADAVVDETRGAGLDILAVLVAAPEWAGGRNIKTGAFPPESPEDYGRFVEAFVTRFKGRIAAYELWNEPNMPRFWGGRDAEPAEFVALLHAGYKAGKKADPDAVFVMGGVTNLLKDKEFIREVLTQGGLKACDAVGIHLYPEDMETFGKQVEFFLTSLGKMQSDKPVWITETGWPSRELDLAGFMDRLKEKGVTREQFLKSVALRRAIGWVYEFSEEELARAQDRTEREKELARYGLTEDSLEEIVRSTARNRARQQTESLFKLSAFVEKHPRIAKVLWYRLDDKFDSPIKEGNFGLLDVNGNPKEAFKLMAGKLKR